MRIVYEHQAGEALPPPLETLPSIFSAIDVFDADLPEVGAEPRVAGFMVIATRFNEVDQ